jgi:hypothetical protein
VIHTQNGNVFAPGIESRRANQRERVQAGIADGSLSCDELSSLNGMRQEARQGLVDSKGDNGWVGPAERRQVHQDLNQISQAIFAFRHN